MIGIRNITLIVFINMPKNEIPIKTITYSHMTECKIMFVVHSRKDNNNNNNNNNPSM